MEPGVKMELGRLAPGRVSFDAPLAGLTTYGLGGPAAALVEPDSAAELARVYCYVRARGLPLFVLGAGSNVLFRDGGFPGVVLKLGPGLARVAVTEEGPDKVLVSAGAAAPLAGLVKLTCREGLGGLEFLAGIPGSVGGALAMNAGAFGGEIIQAVSRLVVMTLEGEIKTLPRSQVRASYRRLDLGEGSIILEGLFALARSTPQEVTARVREILAQRRDRQPEGVRSAGSVFKNPPGQAAGRLIEEAGLKGRRSGGAWVSEKHANFIVHQGRATAREVLELVALVQKEVRQKFGVELEPEIQIVGTDRKDEDE